MDYTNCENKNKSLTEEQKKKKVIIKSSIEKT